MKLSFTLLSLALVSNAVRLHGTQSRRAYDQSDLLELHKSLVEIPSLTGSELAATNFLAAYLTSHSFTVEKQTVASGRTNIYAYLGTTRKTTTLLTSHIDTVPPHIPYTRYPNGTITGRGTNDAKGSVASQIIAVSELIAAGVIEEGDVSLLYVVGEEAAGTGMRAANGLNVAWKSVIFGEPTELKLSLGHKGVMVFTLEAYGKAAHSGYPQLGINANAHLVEALYTLDKLPLPESRLLGKSTLNFGLIRGGTAGNVISPYGNATVAIRLAVEMDIVKTVVDETLQGLGVRWTYSQSGYEPQLLNHNVEGQCDAVFSAFCLRRLMWY